MQLVSLKNVGVKGRDHWLIRDVSFDVQAGEIVSLIGPNGAGKSTTAKAALGMIQTSAGQVVRKQGLKVGYVPQKLAIDWTMPLSVERLLRLTAKPNKEQMLQALERTGIPHLAKAEVQRLSGGEFQRALLARAILRQPDLLVLDEPVQGVDFSGEVALYKLIVDIRRELGCGILLISHDLHVVMAQTDTVICLNKHVCCSGAPSVVASSSEYKQLFGDGGEGALALYDHHHDHSHTLHDGGDGCCSHSHDAVEESK